MRAEIFVMIVVIMFVTGCSANSNYDNKSNEILNSTDDSQSNKLKQESIKFLKEEVSLNEKNYYGADFVKFDRENVSKYYTENGCKATHDVMIGFYDKYNADEWLKGDEKVRLIIDKEKLADSNNNLSFSKLTYDISYNLLDVHYSCSIKRLSHPKYAAFETLGAYYVNRERSASLKEISQDIGNAGFVWLSDIERPYTMGDFGDYYEKELPHIIYGDKMDKILQNNEEFFVDHLCFFRDNVTCFISAGMKHNPKKFNYNVFDFAREIDDFIKSQPSVDEFKPATINIEFENYNVDTSKWEPANGKLQAGFIDMKDDECSSCYIYEALYEKKKFEFGVLTDGYIYHEDKYKEQKKELKDIERFLEYPLRMKVDISDQLGNKGGSAGICNLYKGRLDSKIPDPLTLENLDKILGDELEQDVLSENLSWSDDWRYNTIVYDDEPNVEYFQLIPGRYIFVIGAHTLSDVDSLHYYEILITDEVWSIKVKEIFAENEKRRQEEEAKRLAEEAEEAKWLAECEKEENDKTGDSSIDNDLNDDDDDSDDDYDDDGRE